MREVLAKNGLYVQTSYLYPTEMHRPKLSKMTACPSSFPFSFSVQSEIQAKEGSRSLKNLGASKQYIKESASMTKEKVTFPVLQERRQSAERASHLLNGCDLPKPVPRRKAIQASLKKISQGDLSQEEKYEFISAFEWNPSKWKEWQIPKKDLANLKVVQSESSKNIKKSVRCPTQESPNSQDDTSENIMPTTKGLKPKSEIHKSSVLKISTAKSRPSKYEKSLRKQTSFDNIGVLSLLQRKGGQSFQKVIQQLNICNGVFFSNSNKKTLVYIGKGNNRALVEQLLKKRQHFQITKNIGEAQIVWTQKENEQMWTIKHIENLRQVSFRQLVLEKLISRDNALQSSYGQQQSGRLEIFTEDDFAEIANFYQRGSRISMQLASELSVVQNHLPGHRQISDKKRLYLNLKEHCEKQKIQLRSLIPATFLISSDLQELEKYLCKNPTSNKWISKPSENSNRGKGISIITSQAQLLNVFMFLTQTVYDNSLGREQLVVQEYISDCLLYNRRKFDIRTYILVTNHGRPRCYWYNDGYVRLSGHKFDLNTKCPFVHLTNDAIQCNSDNYGKFEPSNKISLSTLQRYLLINYPKDKDKISLQSLFLQMKEITKHIIDAAIEKMVSDSCFNYEIFGLDFMIDSNFKLLLIEANTNPCIETNCPLLERIIPTMLQQAFRIAIDPVFKNSFSSEQSKSFERGKFQVLL